MIAANADQTTFVAILRSAALTALAALVLAIPLLGEQRELSPQFYLGVAIVLLAVIVHPWLRRDPAPAGAG